MVAQQQISGLAKRLGSRIADAHEAHKDAPVEYGNQRLPEGIENGIAQLTTMIFGEHKDGDNKGKLFFRAAGVVFEPKSVGSVRTEGQQTSIIIPMYDTPSRAKKKTFADHWADYLNIFKQFGVSMPPGKQPGESADACGARVEQYFLTAARLLTEQKPFFLFRTWKGQKATTGPYAGKEPMVNEEWQGITEYHPANDPGVGVTDKGSPSANGHAPLAPAPFVEPPQNRPTPQTQTGQAAAPPPTTGPQPQYQPGGDQPDLNALAEMANADPGGETDDGVIAIGTLTEAARQAGLSDETIASAPDWNAVVAMIQGGALAPPTGGAPKADPVKGARVNYNGQVCEVTSVNSAARTVTLKGPTGSIMGADKKLAKIGFDQLS